MITFLMLIGLASCFVALDQYIEFRIKEAKRSPYRVPEELE